MQEKVIALYLICFSDDTVSIVNNWKESAVTEMEANPGLFADFSFFVVVGF